MLSNSIGDTMAENTNEMALAVVSAPSMGLVGGDVPPMNVPAPEAPAMDSIAIGSPANKYDASSVSVYAQSITPIAYQSADEVACFDVVFSVGINCGDGVSKTYQVVKRIGIDKCKIACEAECSVPVSVVESQQEEKKQAGLAAAKRARILAGLE